LIEKEKERDKMVLTILTTPKEPLKGFDLQHLKQLSVLVEGEAGRELAQADLAPISPRPRPPAEVEKITKCQAQVRRWLAKRQLVKRSEYNVHPYASLDICHPESNCCFSMSESC